MVNKQPEAEDEDRLEGHAPSSDRRGIPARVWAANAAAALVIVGVLVWVALALPPGANLPEMVRRGRAIPTPTAALQPMAMPISGVAPELVLIPAGWFLMGSDPQRDPHAQSDEQPQHDLYLPDYYIGKYPVTVAEYAAFVGGTRHSAPDYWSGERPPEDALDHPVVEVSWHDAQAFCTWLSKDTGRQYRLPSEAEWEKAARGTDGRIHPWGDEPSSRERWNQYCAGCTTPVGSYSPIGDSPYGCSDIAGSLWEWTRSLWGTSYEPQYGYPYSAHDGREHEGAGDAVQRVVRGGGMSKNQYDDGRSKDARCAARHGESPDLSTGFMGFRVVMVPA
jgi:formylglycine-generating enzyme required for sulfatase activity